MRSIGSMKAANRPAYTTPIITVSCTQLPNISSAARWSFCPITIDTLVAAPAPTSIPSAVARFITGNVTAMPLTTFGSSMA